MSNNIELEDGWQQLQTKGINKFLSKLQGDDSCQFTRKEWSELYTLVYNMCTQRTPKNFSLELYQRYADTLTNWLNYSVRPQLEGKQGAELLRTMSRAWGHYRIIIRWMGRFFSYLDRHHVPQNNLPTLAVCADNIFYQQLFTYIKDRLIKACVQTFQEDRDGVFGQREDFKAVAGIFSTPSSQEANKELERALLEQSGDYYRKVAAGWLAEYTFPEYLSQAEQALQQERDRAVQCVGQNFVGPLEQHIIDVVIRDNQEQLLEKETGIRYLIVNNKEDDLARAYRLYSQVHNGLGQIANSLNLYVKERGMTVIREKEANIAQTKKESSDDPEFIGRLVQVLHHFEGMVSRSFANNVIFQRALKSAFETILNRIVGKYTIAEILAVYTDRLLRKNSERLREEEVEEQLSVIIKLFENLEDKDLFAEIYKTLLAKRLLNDTSASEDAEKSFISKMKLCCGAQFTSKLDGMVYDLHLAKDIQQRFSERCSSLPIDFSVQVLTLSFWPTHLSFRCTLPQVFTDCINLFTQYYQSTSNHRKLIWINSLGQVLLTGTFAQGKYDFSCTTFQASLLCLFNQYESLSFDEILHHMGGDIENCKRLLITMLTNKARLLEKTGEPKKINSGDNFQIRGDFKSNIRKIALPTMKTEEHFAKEKVVEDRNLAIEAAIVRIMKSRKSLQHSTLVSEVVSLLMVFRPQIRDIKSRIETLISREFLERNADDPNIYNYLA